MTLLSISICIISFILVSLLSKAYFSRKGATEHAKMKRLAEESIVLDLIVDNFLPENIRQKVWSYFNGETSLEDLQQVILPLVQPKKGFVKYAQKDFPVVPEEKIGE